MIRSVTGSGPPARSFVLGGRGDRGGEGVRELGGFEGGIGEEVWRTSGRPARGAGGRSGSDDAYRINKLSTARKIT